MNKARNRKQKSFPESESFLIVSLCFIDVIWEFYDPSKQNKPTIPSVRDVVSSRRKFIVLDFTFLLTMRGMIAWKLPGVNKKIIQASIEGKRISLIHFSFTIQKCIRAISSNADIGSIPAIYSVIPITTYQTVVASITGKRIVRRGSKHQII